MTLSNNRIKSVQALENLLLQISNEPKAYLNDKKCIQALMSQRKLSAYRNDNLGIIPTALNTIKIHSDQNLNRGYSGLEKLRLLALESINSAAIKEKNDNKTTKKGLLRQLKEKEVEVSMLQEQNMNLLYICQELKRLTAIFSSNSSASVNALYSKEMQRINALLSSLGPIHDNQP